jgi:hypothetical protein
MHPQKGSGHGELCQEKVKNVLLPGKVKMSSIGIKIDLRMSVLWDETIHHS